MSKYDELPDIEQHAHGDYVHLHTDDTPRRRSLIRLLGVCRCVFGHVRSPSPACHGDRPRIKHNRTNGIIRPAAGKIARMGCATSLRSRYSSRSGLFQSHSVATLAHWLETIFGFLPLRGHSAHPHVLVGELLRPRCRWPRGDAFTCDTSEAASSSTESRLVLAGDELVLLRHVLGR
jgi:hypothetical protein